MSTSRVEIDLAAIDHNVRLLRAVTQAAIVDAGKAGGGHAPPKVQFCGVVKQDGYGMGAVRIGKRLAALGVDLLAVYSLDEARAFADSPIKTPVLVLMPVSHIDRADPLYRLAVGGRLHLVLHSEQQAMELATLAARIGIDLPVHVQVDTGMSRGGCLPEEAHRLVEVACAAARFRLAGVMTHFSAPGNDDAFTREQARLFRHWVDGIKPMLAGAAAKGKIHTVVHAANTAAALRSASLHATMVRIGQGMFGYGAESITSKPEPEFARAASELLPAVRWLSRVVHVQEIPAGWPVGYNRTWHARRPTRIGVVPVGYAHGYPLGLSGRGQVRLTDQQWDRTRTKEPHEPLSLPGPKAGGMFVPVVGRVSMDQITIDLTDAPAEMGRVGAEVELVGVDRAAANHLPTLAAQAGTISHEFLCRIAPVVERVYIVGASDGLEKREVNSGLSKSGAAPVVTPPITGVVRGAAVA